MICNPSEREWALFRRMSSDEGWRVPENELALLQGALAENAYVLRCGKKAAAFVTAVRHGRSGWIGNLIVLPDERGKGYGSLLFRHAAEKLLKSAVDSVWLTASKMGRPLYEREGFCRAGTVSRWRGFGTGAATPRPSIGIETLLEMDAAAWGDDRSPLLRGLAEGAKVLSFGSTSALLQNARPFMILGPWLSDSGCLRENRLLLAEAVETAPSGTEIVIDVLDTSPVRPLLESSDFERLGGCVLMFKGTCGETILPKIVSLATLGSMG